MAYYQYDEIRWLYSGDKIKCEKCDHEEELPPWIVTQLNYFNYGITFTCPKCNHKRKLQ